ncbi:alpha-L-rhamnosidase N-terminal domain-containing protein [Bacteroidota bacterium]
MKSKPGKSVSRREFLSTSTKGSALFFLPDQKRKKESSVTKNPDLNHIDSYYKSLDLSPARWIWYPSGRTLQNSVFLFRKEVNIRKPLKSASGWIVGESRYKLYLNGERIQFGPAPCDPRFTEADSVEFTTSLDKGNNIIGAEVLFYGQGDGTWPIGKPGFIFKLDIEYLDGSSESVISDNTWKVHLCRAWKPGQYKRWYLRAFQEEFNANRYPFNWFGIDYNLENDWLAAQELAGDPSRPALCVRYNEYMFEIDGDPEECELRKRFIPAIKEHPVSSKGLVEAFYVSWKRPPEEYFEMVVPEAYQSLSKPVELNHSDSNISLKLGRDQAVALTFEWEEQIVGFPFFTINAPKDTIVEIMVQEGHETGKGIVMNNHFHGWTRLVCQEGKNVFETFDFESLRWLQIHIHNADGEVMLQNVGCRRRIYDWPNQAKINVSDQDIQSTLDASVNTLFNAAQETIVDGMGRERQQYSGDVGHAIHAIFNTFGETRLPARYLNTYSQGITQEGFFLDCWPAYDRLARLMERQLNLTRWGPLLDHGVGFNFDCYYYYLYTGDLTALKEVYPRLLRFFDYLMGLKDDSGLLPVENIGVPAVWIDHDAYQKQKHKQCAFNLYAAAMLENALPVLCEAMGDKENVEIIKEAGESLRKAAINTFWSREKNVFINNKPWLDKEKSIRLCDRSLATAILFDQMPGEHINVIAKYLADLPEEIGLSYPANAGWRLWALAKAGRIDVVLDELRIRWANMDSVKLNNSLQESWNVTPDSSAQWSHIPVAPLYVFYMSVAGIMPVEAGFNKFTFRPQLGDLDRVSLVCNTVKGAISLDSLGRLGKRKLVISIPDKSEAILLLDPREKIKLQDVEYDKLPNLKAYRLKGGDEYKLNLKYS